VAGILAAMARDQKLELLSRIPIFASCNRRELTRLGELAEEVTVPDGKVLMRQGEVGGDLMIVALGAVRIERDGRVLATLGRGDFFGEIALIDRAPRTATATAEGQTTLLVVGHREFHALMEEFPGFAADVMRALAKRVRKLDPDAA